MAVCDRMPSAPSAIRLDGAGLGRTWNVTALDAAEVSRMARNQQVWIRAELLESRPEEILNVELPRLDAQEQHLLQKKRQLQFKRGDIWRALNQRSDRVEEAKKNLQSNTIPSHTAELEATLAGPEAELK